MLFSRLLLLCGVIFITLQTASAQVNTPPAAAAKSGEVAPPPAAPTPSGPQITFNSVYVEEPYIAITFDDGPHATLTPKLLDMLAARRLKATFFVVGQCAVEYPEIMKRIAREGHELANHSWSHPNLGKMSDDAVRQQLQKTDDAIKAATGERTTSFRPPYGSITPRQKQWINESFGYKTIIWDVDPFDWKRPGAGVIRDRIVSQAQPGSIILAHDIHPGTIDAMPDTLDQLVAKGFKFATVSQLLAMAKPAPPKPRVTPSPAVARAAGSPIPATRRVPAATPAPVRSAAPATAAPPSPNG